MKSNTLAKHGTHRRSALLVVALLELLQAGGCDGDTGSVQGSAGSGSAAQPSADQADAAAAAAHRAARESVTHVVSRDDSGAPRLVLGSVASRHAIPGQRLSSEQLARSLLARHTHAPGVRELGSSQAALQAKHVLPAGAELLQFAQYAQGVPVFGAQANVLLDSQQQLVSLANHLTRVDRGSAKYHPMTWCSAEQAVAWAYQVSAEVRLPISAIRARAQHGEWQEFAVDTAAENPQVTHAAVQRVVFPEAAALVPAYHVELVLRAAHGGRANRGIGYVLSAEDGRALYSAELTAHDAFTYRVWIDAAGVPSDGPMLDATPYPRALPDKRSLEPAEPSLIAMEGFNHNPAGLADPWLLPMDTFSFGNNVRAYSDRNQFNDFLGFSAHDGFDEGEDVRADVTSARTFDRSYDLSRAPNADVEQIKAAVTQLFYVTNWLHDYWYDSGFDERSKNAQLSNFGRGGVEGDPLRAEAQDSADHGASNNANMTTLSDGRSPCMQMYVWSGAPNRSFATEPEVVLEDGLGAASAGPQTFDLSAQRLALVLADDGSTVPSGGPAPAPIPTMGSTSDACQKPSNVAGKLAVVDRGSCTYDVKLQNLSAAGALGVLFVDNTAGHAIVNPAVTGATSQLPVLSVSYEDGLKLKAALTSTSTSTSAPLTAAKFARGAEEPRDGTIDNTIVAHEWGHYLHHRLVSCGSLTCNAMSEGWADFVALLMMIRPSDSFRGKVYPLAQYAAGGLNPRATYFGIRRAPYAVDLDKNPFTFQHIRSSAVLPSGAPLSGTGSDMSEVHNVGEIWAEMLFEGYANMIEAGRAAGRSFDDTRRHMADYVVAGMKAAPAEPSFVEQRDALLSAVHAISAKDPARSADFAAIARAFAKRGLGIGAVAPNTSSKDLDQAVESFAFKGELTLAGVTLDDSLVSCDHDGNLDASEAGLINLTITNGGWVPLSTHSVQVSSADPALKVAPISTFPTPPELQPFETATLRFAAVIDPTKRGSGVARLMVSSNDPEVVQTAAEAPVELRYNFDDVPASSTSDDVESTASTWASASDAGPSAWSREGSADNHVWHAEEASMQTDQSLVSPDLVISKDQPLIISFSHRYSFEYGPAVGDGPDVGFDGAVLEISRDGGATYRDIVKYADPGYTGKVFSTRELPRSSDTAALPVPADTNALAGRKAFIGASPNYPEYSQVSLDLGKQFAGKTIKVRFRIATDEGTGGAGWDVDNIAFGTADAPSLVNQPFAALRDDAGSCRPVKSPIPTAP